MALAVMMLCSVFVISASAAMEEGQFIFMDPGHQTKAPMGEDLIPRAENLGGYITLDLEWGTGPSPEFRGYISDIYNKETGDWIVQGAEPGDLVSYYDEDGVTAVTLYIEGMPFDIDCYLYVPDQLSE
jgi:hypothetical protein